MGIFDDLSKSLGISKDQDVDNIEEYMDSVDMESVDVLHEAADFYVKPISLESESDVSVVLEELKQKNLVLLNVSGMKRNTAKLKMIVDNIKAHIHKINGDIARIDEDKILLTPTKVKIVKTRKK
ncbi:MAG: cell division protein SepF [Candidatus Micrarchaeota archaeon]